MSTETLYNRIELPADWPPRTQDPASRAPMRVPWLDAPPDVIPIDVGRQLFVDDFLIHESTLARTFHLARKYEGNPVLEPQTELELAGGERPAAIPFSGGLWFDPADKLFKFWYRAGWWTTEALATSEDGLHWRRPQLNVVRGTNQIFKPEWGRPDSTTVWIDHEAPDPSQRYKMFCWFLGTQGHVLTSADGVHWSDPAATGPTGDRTTMFYNPFRRKWVFSLRSSDSGRRDRRYREHDDFPAGSAWGKEDTVYWCGADALDAADPYVGFPPQLYTLDAAPYESLMLGVFMIHLGPENHLCDERHMPKITELKLGFSRDGFHWHRPDRRAFVPATRIDGAWDRAYLQVAGGCCLVMDNELWFYYSGFSGKRPASEVDDLYAGGATGLAVLRRDGFASVDAGSKPGALTTRPVTFSGSHLFVNAHTPEGELRVEVLDRSGRPLERFGLADCVPVSADSTCRRVMWKTAEDLSALSAAPVRFRFHLQRGSLYAFWVSHGTTGASHGYVAAGGPAFPGPTDTVGR